MEGEKGQGNNCHLSSKKESSVLRVRPQGSLWPDNKTLSTFPSLTLLSAFYSMLVKAERRRRKEESLLRSYPLHPISQGAVEERVRSG